MLKFVFVILLTNIRWSAGTICVPEWFDCGNGKCIPEAFRCDEDDDCGNFNDEIDCESCSSSQFRCKSGDPRCIPLEFYCDSAVDCSDESDEIECSKPANCSGFICGDYKCIPASMHCDGNKDCTDGSDEELCLQEKQNESIIVSAGSSVFYIRPKLDESESVTELILTFEGVKIKGIAYDSKLKYMFIADALKPAIYAINMTSNHIRELESNLTSPEDLSFDWKSNNLYWIDRDKGTVEAMNIPLLRRVLILRDLKTPVALAILPSQGYMFIATLSGQDSVSMYDMDGKNRRVLHSVQGQPVSLALHPSKSILYWADFTTGTISYLDYKSNSTVQTMRESYVTSVAASEDYIYWTNRNGKLNFMNGNITKFLYLPGERDESVVPKVVYSSMATELSECLIDNGGCSYVCLTSPTGSTCACSSGMILSNDNKTCEGREVCDPPWFDCGNGKCLSQIFLCDGDNDCGNNDDEKDCESIRQLSCLSTQFQCKSDDVCIPETWKCDGDNDCVDGSDEIECNNTTETCSGFICRNHKCVPKKWRCDGNKDCDDGSDEELCPQSRLCNDSEFHCSSGSCIQQHHVCDGKQDCVDGSDEGPRCRRECAPPWFDCGNGKCLSHIFLCDGDNDCGNNNDEKDCESIRQLSCPSTLFQCKSDDVCIPETWKCDGGDDCADGSDEIECNNTTETCSGFLCRNHKCVPKKWRCDGNKDCDDGSDEELCSQSTLCNDSEFHCSSGSCIQQHLVCDGKQDCVDGSDEGPRCECKEYFCSATSLCLPWSKVCDGKEDCPYISDEGGLCSTSCAYGKDNCSDICQKTPQGSKCFCNEGFRLLDDMKTCEDVNECHEFGACSQVCSNSKGSYKCSCADGYILNEDNRSCSAEGESPTLMYILEDVIRGIDLETHSSKFHFVVKGANMRGFDYDVTEEVFYWAELNEESIDSYSTRNNSHNVIYRSCSRPIAVRYDWLARNIYFLDEKSNIAVCMKNGKTCKTLIKSGGRRIDSMAISPPTGYMFWTIWASSFQNNRSGVIRRAEMDGSHVMNIVLSNVFSPTAITVDYVLELVYWADMKLKTLECASFNGFRRRKIVQSGVHHPVASVVFEDQIYWIEWEINTIMRCHKFIKGRCENVTDGNAKAYDILVAHKVMQLGRNTSRCLDGNGGCSHLCLTARRRRTKCACPDSMTLSVNERTCLARKCDENEFKCEDGLCISNDLRCDGRKQCRDGSDEENCGTCEELGMHRCKDGTCLKNYQICDGKEDCSDKEDEMNCFPIIGPTIE